jgi:hypothetical protein
MKNIDLTSWVEVAHAELKAGTTLPSGSSIHLVACDQAQVDSDIQGRRKLLSLWVGQLAGVSGVMVYRWEGIEYKYTFVPIENVIYIKPLGTALISMKRQQVT